MALSDAEFKRRVQEWAQQYADILLDEMGIPIWIPVLETICLSPRGCDVDMHLGLEVVAVLAGEYVEGFGWLDVEA